ncbi:MAG: Minf_1886 family protein [bacterium]
MTTQVDSGLTDKITELAIENPRYPREAYLFVFNCFHWARQHLERPRHLSGQEFSHYLVAFARESFGPLAHQVFSEWGIFDTRDFGEIVYTLIEAGLMNKTEEDSIEDFDDVMDLEAALNDPEYELHLPR